MLKALYYNKIAVGEIKQYVANISNNFWNIFRSDEVMRNQL